MEIQEERKPKSLVTKTVLYFKKNGARKGFKKIHNKLFRLETVSYEKWQRGAFPSAHELERQRRTAAAWKAEAAGLPPGERTGRYPFFSIVVPGSPA